MPGRIPGDSWKPEEQAIVRRTYPAFGAETTQRSLAKNGFTRSLPAIRTYARMRLAVYHRREGAANNGLVPLVEVHGVDSRRDGLRTAKAAERQARLDGVLTKSRIYPHTMLVPAEWAERYIAERADYEAKVRMASRLWLTSAQVAKAFGVKAGTIQTALGRRKGNSWALSDHVNRIETIRARGIKIEGKRVHGRFWKPDDVLREVALYRGLATHDRRAKAA